ncbi:NAD-glutamate dehydrogenase [Brevundimonas subvibrioides]|uniref:NAD-glutamate dehydrogenase n=1 Tax=Brevundimonas subvibrioides (strain ATCC 15264 / DSM 4735 / LMG 14903 / NBRC 16000 / CB 81) TaxID=633149 RepID=D9QJR2_BRESC|nr:NAD-glutamate dehydrogenase [Brevundimonas subvibrioides]ADK99663.1 NAD-glutamate dehydrogenase [Brevundimonas subvibrioides ATCC 15264]
MSGELRTSVPSPIAEALRSAFAKSLRAGGALADLEQSFIDQAAEDYAQDETPELDVAAMAALLADAWRWAEQRTAGEAPRILVQPLRNIQSPYDTLWIAQDDRPFLVDSVMGELADAGVSVRALFHPVLSRGPGAERGEARESLIVIVIDPLPPERRDTLKAQVEQALADVHAAVGDFQPMSELMARSIAHLEACPGQIDPEVVAENLAFLRWLNDDHFVFLGARDYDYPRTADGGYAAEAPLDQASAGVGVLRDPERTVLRRTSEPAVLTAQMKQQMDLSEPVTVAKANLRSRVHRRAYMDYVGVKRYGDDGRPSGETRFVGLFTAEAYDRTASDVPLIRRKVLNALTRAAKVPGSHNEKRLRNILENYPRDELFQITEDELLTSALGILHLYDRPRIKTFTRLDPFDRFVSVLAFVPRERFEAAVRERIGRILARAWGGRLSAWYPQLSDAPLVRIHYIIGVTPGAHPTPDARALEAEIAEAGRSWVDRFETALRAADVDDSQIGALSLKWSDAFGAGYRDRYDAVEAVADLQEIDRLNASGTVGTGEPVAVRAFRSAGDTPLQFRFKLYRRGAAVPLSDVLPVLADMGLKTLEEFGHAIRPVDAEEIHVHEFLLEDPRGAAIAFADVKGPFETAFSAVWNGLTESDGFNRLVLELGVEWREAALIRTLARYRQQTGLDPSQAVQEEALRDYPAIARALLSLFACKFDPAHGGSADDRAAQVAELNDKITALLMEVTSLDHDRALRRMAALVGAIKRTNYYQVAADGGFKPHISIKIASRELDDLPLPKPYREIFVWAPHIEGVHLRFGPVARGGLRWSDRRDDFRTEVLGLVKAQQVKNAVIVPVGSKGGFFPKHLSAIVRAGGDRDAQQAEAIRAYRTFLSGLLDITDNIGADGRVVHPSHVVAFEGDDPYLVVAADKGTATFSDIANGVSADYGFWLDDAFASGGSVGYDHKAMGITARGAWEAVKRHFREIGKDIQTEPFTVVGVGDMSGDVFGNGLLLSKASKLVAAFDHRDIFIDPTPDPATSWEERNRLFALPRSSWQDYDASLISSGGGVFSRSAKSIQLTPEIRAALDITDEALDPVSLIRAILKAPAELLYLGGIGTYVKSALETDAQVGDKGTDALRINADELRVKVVGEGANLGFTQAGRIAFAAGGGRINTDAIDNSAGVDTSDHEVNIKILIGSAVTNGVLPLEERVPLLASMTEEVGHKVLAHNYDQTLALTLQQAEGPGALDSQQRFMQALTARGKLDRKVEGLPGDVRIGEMKTAGLALTRPELAVLMAYSKLELAEDIVASRAPEDPFFEETLVRYFPQPLARFEDQMKGHRLRREIVATVLCNEIVNMTGPTFPDRLRGAAGCDTTALVIAFEAARRVFRLDEAWDAVSALDLKVPAETQTALYLEITTVLRRQTFWLARRGARAGATVQGLIEAYRPAADALRAAGGDVLSRFEQGRLAARLKRFADMGVGEDLAQTVSMLRPLVATADIGDLAGETGWSAPRMARLYHQVGAAFDFDRLRAAAGAVPSGDHFDRLAVRRLIEDLMAEQVTLTRAVAKASDPAVGDSEATAEAAVDAWIGPRQSMVEGVRAAVDEIEASGTGWTFAKLTIANGQIRSVAGSA